MFRIPFRGFKDSALVFGNYPSGAVKLQLVSGERLLANLTLDRVSRFDGCMLVKPSNFIEDILNQMLGMDLIDFYAPYEENGTFMYVAGINKRLSPDNGAALKQAAYVV